MHIDFTEVGCFRCAHTSIVEWIKSGCEIHIDGSAWYVPKDNDIAAMFKLNGIEIVNDKVTRLLFIKVCRGYYICDGLRSNLPSYLKRRRKFIAMEGAKRVIETNIDGDAYRFAVTIEPVKHDVS